MTKVQKNNWYCGGHEKLQINLYKFFVEKKGVPLDDLKKAIKVFSERYQFSKKIERSKLPIEHKEMKNVKDGIFYTNGWREELFPIVTEISGVQFKPRPYHGDWMESNLDGSFAYSGVTDDF